MSTDNLMESVFERVLEEKRNNTPINEDNNLLSKSLDVNDIELSAVEDPGCEQSTNPPTDDGYQSFRTLGAQIDSFRVINIKKV